MCLITFSEVMTVKILHTSDLHLKSDSEERWKALEVIVDKAKENAVDILVICGDLFDTKEDASKSYEKLRAIFSGTSFKTLILPGNHDATFYEEGFYLGENVIIISENKNTFDFDNVRIAGIPFKKEYADAEGTFEVLNRANKLSIFGKTNILLFHGELTDPRYKPDDFGEKGRYMPVEKKFLDTINFDYILAGHFHTNFNVVKTQKGFFIYPGSPVSITKKETGKRKINILEIGNEPKALEINTMYYEEIIVQIDPFSEITPIEQVEKQIEDLKLSNNCTYECRPIFKLIGYFNGYKYSLTENALYEKIQTIMKEFNKNAIIEFELKDIGRIIESDVFKKVKDKILKRNLDDDAKDRLIKLFLEAMM